MKLTFYGLWEDERPKLSELSESHYAAVVAEAEVL